MKITIDEIRGRLLAGFGYLEPTLSDIVIPWLREDVTLDLRVVRSNMERWQLFEVYNRTICQNVVASSAIEGEEIQCDEFALLIHYINEEIRKRFRVVSV